MKLAGISTSFKTPMADQKSSNRSPRHITVVPRHDDDCDEVRLAPQERRVGGGPPPDSPPSAIPIAVFCLLDRVVHLWVLIAAVRGGELDSSSRLFLLLAFLRWLIVSD